MTVKHETIKPRRTATAKGVPHLEVKPEAASTPELFADFLKANTPNHPSWLSAGPQP